MSYDDWKLATPPEYEQDEPEPEGVECPGCGCLPGDGLTEGCSHELGCGYWRAWRAEVPATAWHAALSGDVVARRSLVDSNPVSLANPANRSYAVSIGGRAMRQAITTKYFGATDHSNARVRAKAQAGSVTISWDDALDIEENHATAARVLAKKFGWLGGTAELVGGSLPDDTGFCFVLVGDPPRSAR